MRWVLVAGALLLLLALLVLGATRSTAAPAGTVPPHPGRGLWRVAGSVATAVALLLTSFTAWTWLVGLSAETVTSTSSFARPVSLIVFDVDDGDLMLAPGPAGEVAVERRLAGTWAEPTVTETWDGTVFRVVGGCADGPLRLGFDPGCVAAYTMAVPAGVVVDARTRTGDIEARGLEGEARLSSVNDSITVADMAGQLALHTTSGEIVGTGLQSSRVAVRAGRGDVDLRFAAPPDRITVAAQNGTVIIEVPAGDRYRVSVSTTGSQEIDVVHDPDAVRTIEVRSTNADIEIRYS